MSQAGIVDIEGSHPQIPTMFVTNDGTAIPIANILEILGTTVAAHSIPLETTGSGNTVTIVAQYASAAASSVATNAGFASFNSADFTVDANGYVTLSGSAAIESFMVDAFTAPGTNPVLPNGSGIVTITGGQVAAGTTTNVIRTDSLAANTYTIEIQRSQAVASSTVGDNGVSHFNSAFFTVDSNGFVSLNGGAIGETITGDTGGALSPTAGNWNILGSGSITTAGSGSTLTVELTGLTNHAVQVGGTGTTLTQVGPSATTGSVLASNGSSADPSFQTLSSLGAILTITGNSGGAESPSSGNFNILGTGSITVVGSANTETVQLTGLTNHSLLVGAGTATITNLGVATNGQLPIGSTGADPVLAALTAGTGITITNGAGTITISAGGSGLTWNDATGAAVTLAIDNGYVTDRSGGVTYTLPATATLGDEIRIVGKLGAWSVVQLANQQILLGSSSSTVGITGGVASTNVGDCIEMICITSGASTIWRITSSIGNITVT